MKLNLITLLFATLLVTLMMAGASASKSKKSNKSSKSKKSSKSMSSAKSAKSAKSMKSSSTDEKAFKQFLLKYKKVYQTQEEQNTRFETFKKNVREARTLNAALKAKGLDEIYGVTKFSDLDREEFKQNFLGFEYTTTFPDFEVASFDTEVDASSGTYNLGDEGLLTPIKFQGCGDCWAFSATETLETAWAKAGNALVELSTQQMVSCDVGNNGCNGGFPFTAFNYVFAVGGLASEAAYPQTSTEALGAGVCTSPLPEFTMLTGSTAAWKFASKPCWDSPCTEDVNALATALTESGGISAGLYASGSAFSSYTGGVMTAASCSSNPNDMDHAIQIVGYNADASTPYWIVRNSWGKDWGEDGFVFMEMGTNTCGLANVDAIVTSL